MSGWRGYDVKERIGIQYGVTAKRKHGINGLLIQEIPERTFCLTPNSRSE